MKKETLIAISLGIGTGVIIAIAILFATGKGALRTSKIISGNITPTVVAGSESLTSFKIDAPNDKESTDKKSINIKGKAEKKSLIVAHSPTSEVTVETGNKTQFDFDFPLSVGENIIKITSYNGTDIETHTLNIYYIQNEDE